MSSSLNKKVSGLLQGEEFQGLEEIVNLGDKAIPPLSRLVKAGKDIFIKQRSAIALGLIGGKTSVKPLLPLLKDRNPILRLTAVESLGNTGEKVASKDIIRMLDDNDFSVRRKAAIALGKLKEESSVPKLKKIAKEDLYETVKKAARQAIYQIAK